MRNPTETLKTQYNAAQTVEKPNVGNDVNLNSGPCAKVVSTQPVASIPFDYGLIEIYADGDALIVQGNEYTQLSRDLLRRIHTESLKAVGLATAKSPAVKPTARRAMKTKIASPSSSSAPSSRADRFALASPESPKSIHKSENGDGWLVNVYDGRGSMERRLYAKREQARQARWSDAVGERGRIA